MKKASFKEKIQNAIVEQEIFDLETDTEDYPTIHYLIARHLLDDQPEYIIMRQLDMYQGMVKRNLDTAISDLADSGIAVYKVFEHAKGKGDIGKNISCITTKPDYRDAKERHFQKIRKRMLQHINAAKRNVSLTAPEYSQMLLNDGKTNLRIAS